MADITEILSSDQVSDSRAVINENFENLNTDKLEKTNNLSDVSNAATARTNLGLDSLLDLKADIDGTDPVTITVASGANSPGLTINQNDNSNEPLAANFIVDSVQSAVGLEGHASGGQGVGLDFYHLSASPASGDALGLLNFYGKDSGGTKTRFAYIQAESTDITNTSEDGGLDFSVLAAGSQAVPLRLIGGTNGAIVGNGAAAGVVTSRSNQDLILQTGNATTGNITITDGANGNINVEPNGSGKLQQGGVNVALISDVPTQEIIEDFVGGMVTGNTETGISVTYDDTGGKLNFDAQTAGDARYAPIAKGVTNGDTHDHSGGDGAQINHTTLSNIGTNTHAQIDTHIANQQVIYKSADETVNNSDVLQNDNHLILPVAVNEVWAFQMILIINTGATPDFKYSWSVPSGTTMDWFDSEFANLNAATDVQTLSGGANTFSGGTIHGTIYASSTPGNVTLQWAQNLTTPSDTKVLKGSYIIAHRLA